MTVSNLTVLQKLDGHAEARGDTAAHYRKVDGRWIAKTWREHRDEVHRFGRALLALGIEPRATVGILSFNRPEWAVSLLGSMAAGGAGAGIYTSNAPEQVAYVLRHARSVAVVVENAEQLAKVEKVRGELPDLRRIVVLDGEGDGEDVETWDEFLAHADEVAEEELRRRIDALQGDGLATLIYTSGTTGRPKAVMLSHGNLVETERIFEKIFPVTPDDVTFSYLPLAHIAEQMNSIILPTCTGMAAYFAESPEAVPENLREAQPTMFFGVPRVWERFASVLQARLMEVPPLKRALASWAMGTVRRVTLDSHRGVKPGPLLAVKHRLAESLVTAKVRRAVGFSRTWLGVSGAAPIGKDVLEFFAGLGITVYEVWGLSETSGPATWNHPGNVRLGTVGPAMPEVEVRLAPDGEVQVRGPNVFQGYLHDEAATAEAFDGDGWFRTGDLGSFDDDGYLSIIGRKKAILITSGGKNIAPEGIEKELKKIDLVADAVVVGDRRRFVAALLSLDVEALAVFAKEHEIDSETPHEDERVLAAVGAGVEEVNRRFSRVEQVRAFRLLPRNLSIEDGELTPTMKVKRAVVNERWGELIESMYAE